MVPNDFLFLNQDTEAENTPVIDLKKWKVLIVDDEPEVHAVTKLALSDFVFQNKHLEFISAYSGAEGKKIVLENPDAAIILLDVVMETDDAGLQVAEFIRKEAHNKFLRIILRTGQPGQAPERQVIVNYDINDYKSKTELTAQKLFTVMMSSLRSYRDIMSLDQSRTGLESIIRASADLFAINSMNQFIDGIIQQLTSIINSSEEAMFVAAMTPGCNKNLMVVSAQGEFSHLTGQSLYDVVDDEKRIAFEKAIETKSTYYGEQFLVAFCESHSDKSALLYIANLGQSLSEDDKKLIELFTQNVQIAYDKIIMTQEIENTQKEIVMRLSEAVECRSKETGSHVKRVAQYCRIFGEALNMPKSEIEHLAIASPLHDIGKIAIPDSILNKPGRLDSPELAIMRTHAILGYQLLEGSQRPIISAGAMIARDHHEKWDGSGYPNGKKGDEIHLYGRIVAIADVFDALRNKRCYKDQWSKDKTIELIKSESGKHFDPILVEIFLANLDKFEMVLNLNPDSVENTESDTIYSQAT